MRPDTTLEILAKLPTSFKKDGGVTAGNASGIVDGGAALVLASERGDAKDRGLTPLGRLVAWTTVGVEPSLMGMGPVAGDSQLLARTSLTLDDIDLFEINEAFAAQYLAVEQELGLDRDKVNVNGGAIALGHPLGMTGTRLLLTLLLELRRRGKTRGIASACIGGGQGIAALVETAEDTSLVRVPGSWLSSVRGRCLVRSCPERPSTGEHVRAPSTKHRTKHQARSTKHRRDCSEGSV